MNQRSLALVLSFGACAVCYQPLQAQDSGSTPNYNSQYYLFASPGMVERPHGEAFSLAIGGGMEWSLLQHIAAGLELANSLTHDTFINPVTHMPEKGGGRVSWIALNGFYHFQRNDSARKTRPFLTGGCGISGVNNAGLGTQINYGVGFNHWRTKRLGVRVEVRRLLHSGDEKARFTAMRIGLVIR